MKKSDTAIVYAILAALCYGVSTPVSKVLLDRLPPTLLAALLYLGAGLGMGAVNVFRPKKIQEAKLTKKELPFTLAMVVLDIIAPICLMIGISKTTSATASLLNNFEIVVTALVALLVFRESIGRRMWLAIGLITLASILLSLQEGGSITLSSGAVFVIIACVCWGMENNCTRRLSLKDPLQVVVVKGFGSGGGALVIALVLGEASTDWTWIVFALFLGFVAYGMSIYFYILAQREMGAARTTVFYAFAPFIGTLCSLLIFWEMPPLLFWIALLVMVAGSYLAASECHGHIHQHLSMHHEHRHSHDDQHHTHTHLERVTGEHSHPHGHIETSHSHFHTPDLHHTHHH